MDREKGWRLRLFHFMPPRTMLFQTCSSPTFFTWFPQTQSSSSSSYSLCSDSTSSSLHLIFPSWNVKKHRKVWNVWWYRGWISCLNECGSHCNQEKSHFDGTRRRRRRSRERWRVDDLINIVILFISSLVWVAFICVTIHSPSKISSTLHVIF